MINDLLSLNSPPPFFFLKLFRGGCTPLNIFCLNFLDHFFPLLFPKDYESVKILDIGTLGGGDKKTFKQYLKSKHTGRQTDRHTDTHTYKPIKLSKALKI